MKKNVGCKKKLPNLYQMFWRPKDKAQRVSVNPKENQPHFTENRTSFTLRSPKTNFVSRWNCAAHGSVSAAPVRSSFRSSSSRFALRSWSRSAAVALSARRRSRSLFLCYAVVPSSLFCLFCWVLPPVWFCSSLLF